MNNKLPRLSKLIKPLIIEIKAPVIKTDDITGKQQQAVNAIFTPKLKKVNK